MFPWGLHNWTCHPFVCNKCRLKSNVPSFSPPGSCRDPSVLWGLLEAFWLPTKAARAVPWSCASQSVGDSETGTCLPSITKDSSQWEALGKAGSSTSEKLMCLFTYQIWSLLQKTAVIGYSSRQAGLLVVYMTLWKGNMRDHYPCSFKSWKC